MQNQEIKRLSGEVAFLKTALKGSLNDDISWSENNYNYFAIGNSITTHGLADYWWNDNIGMAASNEESDYVHLIGNWLTNNNDKPVQLLSYNFYIWGVQSRDRSETLSLLKPYLSDKLDLVTVQLSENAHDINTFENDCIELFKYIRAKAANAKVVVIDDFWDNKDKAAMKERAASNSKISFVSLNDIKNKKEYQAVIGTKVYDKAGMAHIIEHAGVAAHPNDKGMKYIAESVIRAIKGK